MMQEIRCRRCLLSQLEQSEYIRHLQDYIAAFPEDGRVPDGEYQRRLTLCQSCSQLMDGMCLQCGCYVELRALKTGMHCPHEEPKW